MTIPFDGFSLRWKGGHNDAQETLRVWESLPPSNNPGGYEWLLALARTYGYQLPDDHPWRAENEFEALPRPDGVDERGSSSASASVDELDHLIKSLGRTPRAAFPELLEKIKARLSGLHPIEQRVAVGDACLQLSRRFGSWAAAERLLREPATPTDGPFEHADGKLLLRAADPRDLNLSSMYLVEGRIPGSAVGELVAGYGCGKTWLMVDLALSVAFGLPFLGVPTVQRPVLYLAYEGQHGIWRRMAGWLHDRGLLPAEFSLKDLHRLLEGQVTVAAMPPLFDHGDLEAGLRDSIRELGAGLVIIDTRNKSLGADQSEESNDTAGRVNGVLSRVASMTDCTFFTTHHTGHRNRDRGRGASAWTQGVDFSFLISGDAAQIAGGAEMMVSPLKMRDEEWPQPFAYRLKMIPGLKANGKPWSSAVLEPAEPQLNPIEVSIEARVFWHIHDHPGCSAESIRRGVRGKNQEIQETRDLLLILDVVENRGLENRHEYYVVPGLQVAVDGKIEPVPKEPPEDLLGVAGEASSEGERTNR